MADYQLERLGTREFEHIIQALATRVIAPGMSHFGDGPDGGREATFRGNTTYPSKVDPWNGYIVVQCKFLQRPRGSTHDGAWALTQLQEELDKFNSEESKRSIPEFYLFVTNAVLTPVARTGSKDKAFEILRAAAKKIGIKGYDVWDYDTVCRHLDANPGVRHSFTALITPSDVLAELLSYLPRLNRRTDFEHTITLFLQRELRSAQYVRLEQAGLSAEQRTPLARVFVDLPIAGKLDDHPGRRRGGIVQSVIADGHPVLRPSMRADWRDTLRSDSTADELSVATRRRGRLVVLGGPGQGKSTAAQFVCQLHRAALLSERPQHLLNHETHQALASLAEQCRIESIDPPKHRRFPFHLVLERFASALARNDVRSVIEYLALRISTVTNCSVDSDDVRDWLSAAPWLIVLDGLDEVPAASNRSDLMEQLTSFREELAALDADVQIVATTRSQGYTNEFSAAQFAHLSLRPLPPAQALHYAKRLTAVRHADDPGRGNEILARLERALAEPATARLMQTPLQVTLMATLVERIGEPPRERWRLFEQYYGAVYAREIERDIATSPLLQGRRADVDAIHHRVGLLLQGEGERPTTRGEAARLSVARFGVLVRQRIEENGVEGAELEAQAQEIEKAATDRLVFLVQPEEGQIGFEIRSLQEFAAAEAMLTGKDTQVRARLAAIASIPYWRNVFQFAVGRCFADAQLQHFREDILEICDELNTAGCDSMAATIYEGSRLAVEILKEGVAREQPRYARWLGDRALKLLGVGGLDDSIEALADVYDVPLQTVYEEALRLRLDLEQFEQRIPAWALLVRLADRGIDWAESLADGLWPSEVAHQAEVFRSLTRPIQAWASAKLKAFVERADFAEVQAVMRTLTNLIPLADEGMAGTWQATLQAIFRGVVATTENDWNSPSQQFVPLQVDGISPARLHLTTGGTDWYTAFSELPTISSTGDGWALYRAAVRFSNDPSSSGLAAALREISDSWTPGSIAGEFKTMPWPVAVCIRAVRSTEDLLSLAEQADAGLLGTAADWSAAEERWDAWGVTELDISHAASAGGPLGPWIRERGFPITVSNSYFPTAVSQEQFNALYKVFEGLPSGAVKSRIALFCLGALSPSREEEFEDEIAASDEEVKISISPRRLRLLLEATPRAEFEFGILGRVAAEGPPEEWTEFAEQLGDEDAEDERDVILDLVRDRTWAKSWLYTADFIRRFEEAPDRFGLLYTLSALAVAGASVSISPSALRAYNRSVHQPHQEALLLLELSPTDWDETMVDRVASRIPLALQGARNSHARLRFFLEIVKHTNITSEQGENLLIAIRQSLLEHGNTRRNAGILSPYLVAQLSKRVSQLQDPRTWERLGLPSLPRVN